MVFYFVVMGYFANGRRREAGVHIGNGGTHDFHKGNERFAALLKTEIIEAPITPTGMPKFEYIEVTYHAQGVRSDSGLVQYGFALTPLALEKLNAENKRAGEPLRRIVDMTKFTNPNSFWSKMRTHINTLYSQAFSSLTGSV